MATQIVSRIRNAFRIEVPLRRIFEAPTVSELAVVIEKLIFTEVQGLSDEEALERLGQRPYSMNEKE